jgi:hypothetical protein
MERAYLFMEGRITDLAGVARRYRDAGQTGMAARLDVGADSARRLGLGRIAVVHDFPVALVGFGFTRQHSNERALLTALDASSTANGRKHPLVAVEANTEGVYVELDAAVLWEWCSRNGWVAGAAPTDPVAARAWLVDTTLSTPTSDAAVAIRRATHCFAHVLVHALAGRSSLEPNSVSEYLLEPLGGFIIYASKFTSFNLGALITLAEQHLHTWLGGAAEGARSCVHDPVCLMERGGCHKCIALAFGCERFNRGLHRAYLVGGTTGVDVPVGYLDVAADLAAAADAALSVAARP